MIGSIPEPFLLFLLALLSATIGSFLNVVICRVPQSNSIFTPASHCPKCMEKISLWDNIPILSYIHLRGQCRQCNEKISFRYPMVEILAVILTLLIYRVYGQSSAFLLFTGLAYLLISITFIDIDHFIIPNGFIVLGLVALLPALTRDWLPIHWEDGLNGSLCFAGFLFAMGVIGQFILKKESIGFGDVKLGLVLGGFLGLELSVLALYLSFMSAAAIVIFMLIRGNAKRGMKIPFGPYLAAGTLATLLTNMPSGGNMIINWYFGTLF
jgi:leader peptidase (prepilin peptidase)/N-methyltransferase|tara:strand:- start:88 stop:891 length:804 start_codon:yes stop_codon:yes gene_type:complete